MTAPTPHLIMDDTSVSSSETLVLRKTILPYTTKWRSKSSWTKQQVD